MSLHMYIGANKHLALYECVSIRENS